MRRRTLAVVAAWTPLAGSGCATMQEPVIRTVEVRVPVPSACVPSRLPGPPIYADSDEALRAAPDAAERYRMLAKGRIERDQRLAQVEPVIKACR